MSSDNKALAGQVGCILTIVFAIVLVSWRMEVNARSEGAREARESFEQEAVQHNAATWTVDADGERVFTWNDESEVRDAD